MFHIGRGFRNVKTFCSLEMRRLFSVTEHNPLISDDFPRDVWQAQLNHEQFAAFVLPVISEKLSNTPVWMECAFCLLMKETGS